IALRIGAFAWLTKVLLNAMRWLAAVLVLCLTPTPGAATLAPGDIMVLDIGIGGDVGPEIIFRVDPATGSRTVFENLRDLDRDDRLLETTNMAVERSGNVLVTESRFGPDDVPALYRLDAATGART